MRQKLCKRLEQLEKISAAAAQRIDSSESADSLIEELREVLRVNNFPQEPNESLADSLARFMGISPREFWAQVEELSRGHSQSVHQGGLR